MDFYKGVIPILDDNTPADRDILNPKGMMKGYVERDYNIYPEMMFSAPPSSMKLIEESDWDAIYDEQEQQQSSLEHLYLQGGPNGSPAFINLDQNGQGYCLDKGTFVKLANGALKKIEEFLGGEEVISHTGNPCRVIKPTHRNYTGRLYNIKPIDYKEETQELIITEDHQFLTPQGNWEKIKDITLSPQNSIIYEGEPRRLGPVTIKNVNNYPVFCLEVEIDHSFIANRFTVHNCWAYSTGHALMFTRFVQNEPVIRLNPHATACIIKGGRDEGGWCGLSAKWAEENGYAVEGTGTGQWPLQSMNLRKYDTPELRAEMAKHRTGESYVDLTRQVYTRSLTKKQFATCLMSGIPCPSDWNPWSHSVCSIRWVRVERGRYLPLIINSWKGWGRHGLAVIQYNSGVPDGAVALISSTPSMT